MLPDFVNLHEKEMMVIFIDRIFYIIHKKKSFTYLSGN